MFSAQFNWDNLAGSHYLSLKRLMGSGPDVGRVTLGNLIKFSEFVFFNVSMREKCSKTSQHC